MLTLRAEPNGLNHTGRPRSYCPLWEDSSYLVCPVVPWGERGSSYSAVDSSPAILLRGGSRWIVIVMDVIYIIASFPAVAGNARAFML